MFKERSDGVDASILPVSRQNALQNPSTSVLRIWSFPWAFTRAPSSTCTYSRAVPVWLQAHRCRLQLLSAKACAETRFRFWS